MWLSDFEIVQFRVCFAVNIEFELVVQACGCCVVDVMNRVKSRVCFGVHCRILVLVGCAYVCVVV